VWRPAITEVERARSAARHRGGRCDGPGFGRRSFELGSPVPAVATDENSGPRNRFAVTNTKRWIGNPLLTPRRRTPAVIPCASVILPLIRTAQVTQLNVCDATR
jgi:hypothetical protein